MPQDVKPALEWLLTIFPGRIDTDAVMPSIKLDGPAHSDHLPIEFYEVGDEATENVENLGAIDGAISFERPADLSVQFSDRPVPVIACHSVKGGTGRTTIAATLAQILDTKTDGPILLVDGDLEAPGLSYIYQASRPDIDVALEDLINLAHAEDRSDKSKTIEWVSSRLTSQRLGNILILPLRRSLNELASSSIRAEHVASRDRPFAFADLLSQLADQCGCKAVIVDVRAGLVPLAAQLMLDPYVARVIVTSVANQSLEATASLAEFIGRELRKRGRACGHSLVVVNRIPGILRELGQDESLLAPYLARIQDALLADGSGGEISADEVAFDTEGDSAKLTVVKLGEVADLHVPARRWDGFSEQLENSGFIRRLKANLDTWLDDLFAQTTLDIIPEVSSTPTADATTLSADLTEKRRLLANFTNIYIAAETSDEAVASPLITGPMKALIDESALLPIAVCEGAKGTGKTLTARYLLSKKTWKLAALEIADIASPIEARFLPVLGSVQSSGNFQSEIDHIRQEIADNLGHGSFYPVQKLREFLRDQATRKLTEKEWTDIWLDAIAWSAGFFPGDTGAGDLFLTSLGKQDGRYVALIEGVEELYDNPSDPALAPMLKALLLDLPLRLRAAPGRPVGLALFARRDTVDAGVLQNRGQFRQQYQDYALTWDEGSVLDLAAWLATESKAAAIWDDNFKLLSYGEKEQKLARLWGLKLGPDEVAGGPRVQEAYTAGWVIAVLSDLQERLVARDLVRYLHHACSATGHGEVRSIYGSRLLYPAALKAAVRPTSVAKITETEEEIPELVSIFNKFRETSNNVKAPIDSDSVSELTLNKEDLEKLRLHGIILGESPPYEVPELYRMGLGLKHAGARYSVVGLRKRIQKRFPRAI